MQPQNTRAAAAPPKNFPASPWGKVEDECRLTDNLWIVHTASHGGYLLAEQEAKSHQLPWTGKLAYSRDGRTFRAFEEDCEWAWLAIAYPPWLKTLAPADRAEALYFAEATARYYWPDMADVMIRRMRQIRHANGGRS